MKTHGRQSKTHDPEPVHFRSRQINRLFLAALTVLSGLMGMMQTPCEAAAFWESYMPPEVAYAHHLKERVRMPGQVDLNRASLEELKTLPGVDENIALKLIRLRPLQNLTDLQRLPCVPENAVRRLTETLQTLVSF